MKVLIYKALKYLRFYGGLYVCNICNRPIRHFFPFSYNLQHAAKQAGFNYDFRRMETLNYDNCNCPFCLSNDRERLYMLYLSLYFAKHREKQYQILDFAPSESFSRAIKKNGCVEYTSADYLREDFDLKLDVCNMNGITNDSYDIVICSHILEHVANPNKALSELKRVLKPGGFAIIMVPLFWDVKETIEDTDFNTDELRRKYYGQSDHVCLFAKEDFVKRIIEAGFTIEQLDVSFFESNDTKKYAIADNSILYVCHKP